MCLRVAKHFQTAGARVRIIGFPDQANSESLCSWEHEGVEVQELRKGRREDLLLRCVPFLKKRKATFPLAVACYNWAYSRQISRLCHGSSVFHYFGTGMEMNGYPVAKAAKISGANFFIDPALHAGQWGDTWMDALLYKAATRIFTYSEFEKSVLTRLGIKVERCRRVTCGFDFRNDGNASVFFNQHSISGPLVLFLGRKTTIKGAGRLLAAWPTVAKMFPSAQLAFVGASKWKDESLINFSKNKINGSRILDLDDVSDQEKQDALAACDIMCVPSEGESFGMVYYEAWAYKKPVVALDLPVLQESIGKAGGGLLTKSDPKSIAEALIKMLSDGELCPEMGSRGYELAWQHDWPKALASYSEAYREAGVKL